MVRRAIVQYSSSFSELVEFAAQVNTVGAELFDDALALQFAVEVAHEVAA